jgi:hypothetical protein
MLYLRYAEKNKHHIPRRIIAWLLLSIAVLLGSPAQAQTTLTATFTRGAIAEYSSNPNGTSNASLFATLNIASISISQNSSNGTGVALKATTLPSTC